VPCCRTTTVGVIEEKIPMIKSVGALKSHITISEINELRTFNYWGPPVFIEY